MKILLLETLLDGLVNVRVALFNLNTLLVHDL